MALIDKEPYFDRYKFVLVIAARQGNIGPTEEPNQGQPKLQHRTCGALIDIPKDLAPPKICPACGADCIKEIKEEEKMKADGIEMPGSPERPVVPVLRAFIPLRNLTDD